ncbi:recombinase family protein [Streptomyces sp. NPDC101234]|uniref:recombinase family protein n=1 Tax=Streptomyces sp. NPDC101234 TaxID=3366138 RepID=UPI003803C177
MRQIALCDVPSPFATPPGRSLLIATTADRLSGWPGLAARRCAVSGNDRLSTPHQIDTLLSHEVERNNMHIDTASGAKAFRPKLDLVLQLLRPGDTLKITRLDRLSRSVLRLVTLGAELRERGIVPHVIERGIDTAAVEDRAMDGPTAARGRGRVGGRRPKLTEDQAALAQQLYDPREKTVQQIADLFGAPRSTVYGHLSKPDAGPRQPKKTMVTKP